MHNIGNIGFDNWNAWLNVSYILIATTTSQRRVKLTINEAYNLWNSWKKLYRYGNILRMFIYNTHVPLSMHYAAQIYIMHVQLNEHNGKANANLAKCDSNNPDVSISYICPQY